MVLSCPGVPRRGIAPERSRGSCGSRVSRRSRTVSPKSPVAIWTSEELGSPEEEYRRGRSSKRICGRLEKRGYDTRTRRFVSFTPDLGLPGRREPACRNSGDDRSGSLVVAL